ncbi:6269_t:CDS:2, partial [Funneliformis geosporum]
QDVLQKYAKLVLQKHSNLRNWTIEEKKETKENFVYFNRKAPLGCPLCKRIHDKDQRWFSRICARSGEFIVKCFRQNSDKCGEVFECDPSIAEKIQQENKNLPQASHKIKGPGFPKAFLKFPSWVKYDDPLIATETYKEKYVKLLPNEGDIYVGSSWETGKTYILEHLTISDNVNLLVLSTRHSYSNAVITRLNLKSYCDINDNINLSDHKRVVCQIESLHCITNNCKCNKKCKCLPIQYDLWLNEIVSIIAQAQSRLAGQSIEKLYKLIQEARRIIVMDNNLTDLNIEWIKTLQTVLAELWDWVKQMISLSFEKWKKLRIKEYHSKSDSVEKATDFDNVEETWINVDLVVYTKINAGTNQMLFHMRCIKDYICHIEQRSSNVPIIEKGLFQWLLNAKRECLPRELQNRGIFPDIDSVIQNKDMPTIRLWIAFIEAGMIISIIESDPKSNENVISLSQVVKTKCTIVKAEKISDIFNATIVNHETAEILENRLRKTLKEMRSLDQYHIVNCYQVPPELLTEYFIS